ncbi:hypothetical protein B9Z55_000526 [Caenorhabditis nigoni]|uniref:Uncharacterized protein n=1 Tax=Caenorhabditis nigoni TaxID=1611254 RepID=A0A2G5VTK7_9PELO|nr:hypothetical protein B9Z55_000526 [Caenorhabditis nigoni]
MTGAKKSPSRWPELQLYGAFLLTTLVSDFFDAIALQTLNDHLMIRERESNVLEEGSISKLIVVVDVVLEGIRSAQRESCEFSRFELSTLKLQTLV